jgi:Zn finger protein HypA/HybF involved in hydrogenase expression
MAAHTGEKAQRTGDFRCEKCRQQVHVSQGSQIPRCPNCGNESFGERNNEPGNKSS